jgi:hypothetical protein
VAATGPVRVRRVAGQRPYVAATHGGFLHLRNPRRTVGDGGAWDARANRRRVARRWWPPAAAPGLKEECPVFLRTGPRG